MQLAYSDGVDQGTMSHLALHVTGFGVLNRELSIIQTNICTKHTHTHVVHLLIWIVKL